MMHEQYQETTIVSRSVTTCTNYDGQEEATISFQTIRMDLIEHLPLEIAALLFSRLSILDLLACRLVSKTWNKAIENNSLWRDAFIREISRHNAGRSLVCPLSAKAFIDTHLNTSQQLCAKLNKRTINWCKSINSLPLPFISLPGPTGIVLAVSLLVASVDMNPSHTRLLLTAGGGDKILHIWEWSATRSFQLPQQQEFILLAQHDTQTIVQCVGMIEVSGYENKNENDIFIACAGHTNEVRLYSLKQGYIRSFALQGSSLLTLSLSCQYIVTSDIDGFIVRLNWHTGVIHLSDIHQGKITSVKTLGTLIASGSIDGSLLVYDTSTTPPAFVGNFGTHQPILSLDMTFTSEKTGLSTHTHATIHSRQLEQHHYRPSQLSCVIVASTGTGFWSIQLFPNNSNSDTSTSSFFPPLRRAAMMYMNCESVLNRLSIYKQYESNFVHYRPRTGSDSTGLRPIEAPTTLISHIGCTPTHIVTVCGHLIHIWQLLTLQYVTTLPYDKYIHDEYQRQSSQTSEAHPVISNNSIENISEISEGVNALRISQDQNINNSVELTASTINGIACVEDCVMIGSDTARVWMFWPI